MEDMTTNESQEKKTPPPFYNEYAYRPRKNRWWIIPVVIVGVLLILGFMATMFFVGIGSAFEKMFEPEDLTIKDNTVLLLDIEDLSEVPKSSFKTLFSGGNSGYFRVVNAIENAADDDKIKGIYYKAGYGFEGFAQAEGIQEAIAKFKESGKFFYAYLPYTTETQYFNALQADSIFMPEEVLMEFNGFATTGVFYKGFFDKIGLKFNVIHFEDFKSMGETYNRTSFSDSSRHNISELLAARYDMIVDAVSEYRNIPKDEVIESLTKGIYSFEEAKEAGLVDVCATEQEITDLMKERTGNEDMKPVSIKKYAAFARTEPIEIDKKDTETKIAIVNAEGAIMVGDGNDNPFASGENQIYSGKLSKTLTKVRDDEEIDAVILRINSPGGSVLASEEIYDAVVSLKKVKPVFASMGNVAASGGYFIAMPCDKIFADASTITGSIGVVSAIPNFNGTIDKLGITLDQVKTNEGASFMDDLTMGESPDSVLKRFTALSEKTYFRFLERVAEHRNMTFDQVRTVAKGRVWTGLQAHERGLTDEIGGLDETIDAVKEELGLDRDVKIPVVTYPTVEDEIEAFFSMFGLDQYESGTLSSLSTLISGRDRLISRTVTGMSGAEFIKLYKALPEPIKTNLDYQLQLIEMAEHEKSLYAMPLIPVIR